MECKFCRNEDTKWKQVNNMALRTKNTVDVRRVESVVPLENFQDKLEKNQY